MAILADEYLLSEMYLFYFIFFLQVFRRFQL